jgi:glycine dehydrogenase subunit 2
MPEPLLFEVSRPGRSGVAIPTGTVPETPVPADWVRSALELPEVSEVDVVRHYVRLSHLNYSVDSGFYPLGSCTMKYNPKVNEAAARLEGFTGLHPLADERDAQGALALMHGLQSMLAEIGGFAAVSLQPAAGAHGELTGILILRRRLADLAQSHRTRILVPDSAHGTNPASTAMAGFEAVEISSDARGNVDIAKLKAALDERTAGLMLTNPNTLGLFEERLEEVTSLVHEAGGLVYGDGANMNALLGVVRPGDLGLDVLHYNLHKTFSTPHGGGGPGSGPVGVAAHLVDFLPDPVVDIIEEGDDETPPLYGFVTPAKTIGRVKAFHGHFGMMVRAFTYMRMHGAEGIRKIAEYAVLNANYLLAVLRDTYHVPYDRVCMHEFVLEGQWSDAPNVHALDIAKRLMDYNFHPPTNYFPLIVHEALMIEPTETESKETLDAFADALIRIAEEAHTEPETLKSAPHNTPVGRLDEVKAAKELVLCCGVGSLK